MTSPLLVWLHGHHIGTLTATRRGGATFHFQPQIVESQVGLPMLSTALPVQAGSFDPVQTRTWFAGLLPEDRQLDEVRRRFNLQSGTYLDVLTEVGWECAGSVVVGPIGTTPPLGRLQSLSTTDLSKRLTSLPSHPYDDNEALRLSLGGFQAKLLVTRTEEGWSLPIGGAISTHILKPQPTSSFPGLIAAEAWAMQVAGRVTETASVQLLDLDDGPLTLAVERFDRRVAGSTTIRLHQEDAAQAMGTPTERKYASSGSASRSDPSLARLASVLERFAGEPRDELRRLVEQLTVNVGLGNTDAHAKNYGVLHPSAQTVSLSPMYDVVPSNIINPGMLEMGMRVDTTLRLDRVTGAKLVREAGSWGLGERVARSFVEAALNRLRESIGVLDSRRDERLAADATARVGRLLDTL